MLDTVKNYYAQARGGESLVISKINILMPIVLSLFIIIGHMVWSWFGGVDVSNLLFMLGGVWVFYCIIVATHHVAALKRQVERQGRVFESMARAVEQLSSKEMSIRILGILSLGKIAIEGNKKTCRDIIDVLCADLRGRRPAEKKGNNPPFTEDLQKIVDVLGKIQKNKFKYSRGHINLSRVDLSGADLSGADLSGADLSGANLSSANLLSADLSSANLLGADLSSANLLGANLSDTNLAMAELSLVDLSGADLSGADLLDVYLLDAKGLETVKSPPQTIRDEIARRKQDGGESLVAV